MLRIFTQIKANATKLTPIRPCRVHTVTPSGPQFLLACWKNDPEEIQAYLKNLTPDLLSFQNEHGWSAVTFAVTNNNTNLLQQLIQKGANLNTPNRRGWYPIHYAAGYAHLDILDLLLENGADIESKNTKNGWTPLHRAVHWGRKEGVHYLLEHNADISATDFEGKDCFGLLKINSTEILDILNSYVDSKQTKE